MGIENVLKNEYVTGALIIFLTVYASLAQAKLPNWLTVLFKNDIFRVVYLSLLLMIPFEKAPHVAITVALLFVITMAALYRQDMREKFESFEAFVNNERHNFENFENFENDIDNVAEYDDINDNSSNWN